MRIELTKFDLKIYLAISLLHTNNNFLFVLFQANAENMT